MTPQPLNSSASQRLRFRLTRKHIENGQPCDTDCCPLALCIGEGTGLKTIVVVDTVDFYDEEHSAIPSSLAGSRLIDTIPLPPSAAQFRKQFDARNGMITSRLNEFAERPRAGFMDTKSAICNLKSEIFQPFEFELALTAPVLAAIAARKNLQSAI